MQIRRFALIIFGCLTPTHIACAADQLYAPTARMNEQGTVSLSVAHGDPYTHGILSAQLKPWLSFSLRQSVQSAGPGKTADRLYPGLDLKFRLLQENKYLPETSFGIRSLVGHRRLSGEYLAFSKKFYDVDVTAGLGWGRFAGQTLIDNPFRLGRARNISADDQSTPDALLSGGDIGGFARIDWQTPLRHLKLHAAYGSHDFGIEAGGIEGYKPPKPWQFGFDISPFDWLSYGASVQGGDKVLGYFTLRQKPAQWRNQEKSNRSPRPRFSAIRRGESLPTKTENVATARGYQFHGVRFNAHSAYAKFDAKSTAPTALRLGRSAQILAENSKASVETLILQPFHEGLQGPEISIQRRDLAHAIAQHKGSASEIWQNMTSKAASASLLDVKPDNAGRRFGFLLDLDVSLAEEDTGPLFRSSALLEYRQSIYHALKSITRVRFNLADRLSGLDSRRNTAFIPTRSNLSAFTDQPIRLDSSFLRWTATPVQNLHILTEAGLFEEMYGGIGGEILWRPWEKPYAFGIEGWQTLRRAPQPVLGPAFIADSRSSYFANIWYELPNTQTDLSLSAGQFLGGDRGIKFKVNQHFDNGARLSGFLDMSQGAGRFQANADSSALAGIQLSYPLGDWKNLTNNTARLRVMPLGRDSAQSLDRRETLYDLTEPLSYRHISTHWQEITQ